MAKTDKEKIRALLSRSVDRIYPSKSELEKVLISGKKLRVYMGIDPTADYVHLGHSTNYIILKRFHELGHKIIVLIGDFTAMIGDPSDKSSMRVRLTKDQVKNNLATFKKQIGKILDFDNKDNPISFEFNSKWLSSMSFEDVIDLASNFTVQQMIERDNFEKRIRDNKPLYIHEFFYPLMQGYDTVALKADVEVGGTDQTFNMLAGRILAKKYQDREKYVVSTTLLENPLTGEKLMSKSLGTGIALNEKPKEMFGKIMSLPDEAIIPCFIDCTYLDMKEIEKIESEMKAGKNPRDYKMRLAREIVTIYHSQEEAKKAEESFINQFSRGNAPKEMLELEASGTINIVELIDKADKNISKSEARRLIEQGAVSLDEVKIEKNDKDVEVKSGMVLKVGKRRYWKIK